ncbi:20894_t:CDS:2, partial [Racocetra persica]
DNIGHTFIHDNNGQPELLIARNNPYINLYNRLQLQDWHANVDLKLLLNIHAILQYVAKYASKSEPWSAIFSEILNHILHDSNPLDSSLGNMSSSFWYSTLSLQCCFVTLNLNKKAPCWLCGTRNEGFVATCQEEFCHTKVLLHVRYRNELVDMLGPSVDKVEDFDEDVEDYQLETKEEEVLSDWMILAGIGLNASVCDADQNHDWFRDVRQYYQNFNLADVDMFIQQICCNEAINDEKHTQSAGIEDYPDLVVLYWYEVTQKLLVFRIFEEFCTCIEAKDRHLKAFFDELVLSANLSQKKRESYPKIMSQLLLVCGIEEFETEELENEIVKDDELIISRGIGKTELDDLLQKLKGLQ